MKTEAKPDLRLVYSETKIQADFSLSPRLHGHHGFFCSDRGKQILFIQKAKGELDKKSTDFLQFFSCFSGILACKFRFIDEIPQVS